MTAIGTYLRFAISDALAAQYDSPIEMMGDPKLIPVMDDCCNFCWFHSNPQQSIRRTGTRTRRRILAGRPATFQLLDAIWLRYQVTLRANPNSNPRNRSPIPTSQGNSMTSTMEK